MSRKDYVLIAQIIKSLPNNAAIAEAFAVALASTNSSFNREIFLKACKV